MQGIIPKTIHCVLITVEPHYYSHLRAELFWLLYRGGCFTEVQMYGITSLGTWLGSCNNEVAA